MNRLAILGGKPFVIPLAYGRQWIDDHDVESVVEVLKETIDDRSLRKSSNEELPHM